MPEPNELPPKIVVDTSVIIDFYLGGLLPSLFELPFHFLAPDVIIAELQDPKGVAVMILGLHGHELSVSQLLEVRGLSPKNTKVSLNDLQAFVLARDLGAMLLTSDGPLRNLAQENGVGVHGTLWLLDEMVRLAVISQVTAANAIRRMLDAGCRLPKNECEARLRLWESDEQ